MIAHVVGFLIFKNLLNESVEILIVISNKGIEIFMLTYH